LISPAHARDASEQRRLVLDPRLYDTIPDGRGKCKDVTKLNQESFTGCMWRKRGHIVDKINQ